MLTTAAIFLAAAVLAVSLFRRLGLGSVLGYLAAGAVIGPAVLRLVDGAHQVERTMHIAELGVVLLLFLIGLELQPARLWRMRATVFGLGGAQVLATGLLFAVAGVLAGLRAPTALVAGLALAMSSTALVLQVLEEKSELTTPHGQAAFGILLFQDVAAIPVLALIPVLGAQPAGEDGRGPLLRVALAVGVIAGLVVAGRYLLRPVFRFIAAARSHELSTASALLVVVGTALLMQLVGLSMALGAFLAGVLLANSEYRHELEANIEPFKGLLLGLFFIAVGMSANLRLIAQRPLLVCGLVAGLVAGKALILALLGRLAGLRAGSALSLGVALSQGGEFAFVIFGAAQGARLLDQGTAELLVIAVTLSMVTTPLLLLLRDRVATRRALRGERREFDAIEDNGSHVIIAGYGRFGQIVSRLLRVKKIPFTALEVSPAQVDFVRRFGNRIYYGDASRVDLLRAARADKARVFVLAIDDPDASVRTAQTVQRHFPNLKIIARARNRQHAYALLGMGIAVVLRETFLSSLEAGRHVLQELGLPEEAAAEAVRRFGEYDEQQVQRLFELRDNEQALIAQARRFNEELERLFEVDTEART